MKYIIIPLLLCFSLCTYAQDHDATTCLSPSLAFKKNEDYYQLHKKEIDAQKRLPGTNTRAIVQSIHNAIVKWDGGSYYRFEIGTAPGLDDLNRGHLLRNTDKHTYGHSYEDIRRSALAMGNTFNIGDTFYFSMYDNGQNPSWVSPPLRFEWEDLGNANNELTIRVETNYGVNGLGPYAIWQRDRMMRFYNLVNPIIKEIYGPPSRDHDVSIVNDGNAVGTNVFYNGPNQISSTYLERNGDLDQPRLMIHELLHAYRDNVILSSDETWHYVPTLSGFEEGMAEAVAIIVMDIFIDRYPNFFNGDEFKIHWSHSRGMPFDWDYDFQNHEIHTTTDFFSTDIGTGSHWQRYGISQTVMQKMYLEDPDFFKNFNAEYYRRLNADHNLVPSRALLVDILTTILPSVERTPIGEWVDRQRILDCRVEPGDKVHMLTFHSADPPRIHTLDNRVHIYETQNLPGANEWSWDEIDDVNPANSMRWYVQTNNIQGQLQIYNYDNTLHQQLNIINDKNSRRDNRPRYLGPYQGGNYMNYNGVFTANDDRYQCTQPGCGKRPFGIETHNFSATSTTDRNHNDLPRNYPDPQTQIVSDLTDLGLYRYEINFEGGRYSGTYYRLHGQDLAGHDGIMGGIKSLDDSQNITGRLYIEHEDFGEEPVVNIDNGAFIADRTWAAVPETEVHRQGGRTDRRYSVPGKTHAIYISEDCSARKIDFRNILYGDGLSGSQLFLYTVEHFQDIEFTAPDITICEGETINLDVSNNFPEILNGDSRITYEWFDQNNISIANTMNHEIPNAQEALHEGLYRVEINFFNCPLSLEVNVIINNTSFEVTTPDEITLCEQETLTIQANTVTGATYTWTGPNGYTATTQSISIPNITIAQQGDYTVTVTAPDCAGDPTSLSSTTTVNVNPDNDFEVTTPDDLTLCEQETLTIQANAVNGGTYAWTGPNGFTATTQDISIPNITIANQGDYTVTITALNCAGDPISRSNTTTVTINEDITIQVTNPNQISICEGEDLDITTSNVNGATYAWTGPNGFTASTQNIAITGITTAQQGDYVLTVSATDCQGNPISESNTTTVTVNTDEDFEVTTPDDLSICEQETLTIQANVINGATYAWTGPNGFTATTQSISIPNITTAQQGGYTVTITALNCVGNTISRSNTTNVTVNPIVVITITTPEEVSICEGQDLTLETDVIAGATYEWVGPNGFTATTPSITIPNITVNQQGDYTVTVTTLSCEGSPITESKTTTVTVDTDEDFDINTPDQLTLCEQQTLTIEANVINGATYAWVGPNGFSADTRSITIPNVTNVNQGDYTVTATVINCIGDPVTRSNTTAVIINSDPVFEAITPSNITLCETETLDIQANLVAGATYAWTGPNGFTATTQNISIPNITTAQQGDYTVSITLPDCLGNPLTETSTTAVVINTTPDYDINIPTLITLCEQQTLTIEATLITGAIYQWTGPNGFTSDQRVITVSNIEIAQQGTYTVTASGTTCLGDPISSTASTDVVVEENTVITLQPLEDIDTCEGETILLSTDEIPNASYAWTGPNNFSANTREITLSDITTNQAGRYTVTVSATNCDGSIVQDSSSLNLIIEPSPNIDLSGVPSTTTACFGNSLFIEIPEYPNATYLWVGPNNYFSTLNDLTIDNFNELHIGTYTLTITVDLCNGTSIEESHSINVMLCPPEDMIPRFFTPNGDGHNDVWAVNPNYVPFETIYIYDRFGKLLTQLAPSSPSWDGLYNGRSMPSTEYWFSILYTDNSVYKGHFSLIR